MFCAKLCFFVCAKLCLTERNDVKIIFEDHIGVHYKQNDSEFKIPNVDIIFLYNILCGPSNYQSY